MEQLKINLVDGEGLGNRTRSDDVKGRQRSSSALTLNHERDSGSITLDTATALLPLCGVIANSTAADVAGIVVDFNALLSALRLANIIG